MSLTINVATRGRPQLLLDTVAATLKAISLADTVLMISVDADDAATLAALEDAPLRQHGRVLVSVRPREDSVGEKWNRAITEAPADVYLPAVDYAPILTPGFDRIVSEAAALFPDGVGCVYGPLANASFPSLQAVTHRCAALCGGIYPTIFPFWFVDHWLDDVARISGRIAFADVFVQCQAQRPRKTIELRDLLFWAAVFDAGQLVRRRQAFAVIDALDEPEWRKAVQRSSYPLVEARSLWVNQMLRAQAAPAQAARGEADAADARYERIKARAARLLLQWVGELEQAASIAAAG